MSIAENLTTIAKNQQKVFDAGVKSEYDRFWDNYQKNGEPMSYAMAFGSKWDDITFKPKYPIIATGNGNQTIGTYGDNYRVVTGNGNNKIGFYGFFAFVLKYSLGVFGIGKVSDGFFKVVGFVGGDKFF